jgi:hypothetical protein
LFRHAENDYTRCMRPFVLVFIFCSFAPFLSSASDSAPRDLLALLNALRLDGQNVYTVSAKDRIELRQTDVLLTLERGKIAFFQPFEGNITGFVFSGLGHALAYARDPSEKQQMARFLGAPVLDQQFVSAYVRFTDGTARDLLGQLQRAGAQPAADAGFVAQWASNLDQLNPSHSVRILTEKYSATPRHFFHAGIDGAGAGPFDVLVDYMRPEAVFLGQPRTVAGASYYDVWASYGLPGSDPPPKPFDALRYHVDTTIHPDNSLEGSTSIDFRALTSGEQILFVQLSRSLKVESVSLDTGADLPFFQNEGLTEQQLHNRGDDNLCVFLPKPAVKGETFTLRFRYRGNVIANAGNGVFFVGARESWYPHFGDASEFSSYDLSIRWPKRLRLVATGEKSEEHEDGGFRVASWKAEQPVPVAGFNLGEYAVTSITTANRSVDVYANNQLEAAILARLSRAPVTASANVHSSFGDFPGARPGLEPYTPSPADALKQLARDIDSSIHFYERYSGQFPFRHLGVSQIPGTFGQGWPGLLYISTLSFLPREAQERAGLSTEGQELFTEIVPFHEVAHQWWGNVVGWSSYRDQWIDEAMANYLALLFADSQKNPDQKLHAWLERYRKTLTTKPFGADIAPADTGPLFIGTRLSSSKSPEAYDQIVYAKGAWVMHMLREMLRQPNSSNPDARFVALLRTLVVKYAQKGLSTAQLQHEVEAVMTPKMDLEGGHSMEWFFDEYVRGTGVPRYKVGFTSRRTEKGFQVRGKLYQSGVPHYFIAPVPLYVSIGAGRSVYLGTVLAAGEETPFSFITQTDPHKLLIDPHLTLLCVPE